MRGEAGLAQQRLALARRLTRAADGWAIWKNVESALAGRGDVDSVAPLADHPRLALEFRAWAATHELGPVLACPHLPGSLLLVAVRADGHLEELQLCQRAVFRGSALFSAEDLTPLLHLDPRGYRRLRPGAEGLFLLLHNGMRHGGRRASEALKEKSIAGLLRSDPEGVRAAAEVLGWGGLRAEAAAQALVEGGWDRRRLVEVEVWALARSFRDPELLLARAAFRLAGSRYCKVLSALQRGRRVAGDVGRFLQVVARNHQVLRPPPQGS